MINSRNLADLLPVVAAKASAFVDACRAAGIVVLVTSTYRDNECQTDLYAQGRTKPGKIVTRAKAGQSWHNWRCAFDFVPMAGGVPQWSDTAAFTRCGIIAESLGLEWAGRWQSMRELAHCQYTGGLSLTDLQAGKKVT